MYEPKRARAHVERDGRSHRPPAGDRRRTSLGNQEWQRRLRGTAPASSAGRHQPEQTAHDSSERQAEEASQQVLRRSEGRQTKAAPGSATDGGQAGSSTGPLDPLLKNEMEAHFAASFSDVRIHTGNAAAQSAAGLDARAYTLGPNIVFAQGEYAPDSHKGRLLLAHELAHVLQQRSSGEPRVQRAPRNGSEANLDPRQIAQFWANFEAVGEQERGKALAEAAVQRMIEERGADLQKLQKEIDRLEKKGFAEDKYWIDQLKAQQQGIVDLYNPSPQVSRAPYAGLFMRLPANTVTTPLSGPPEFTRQSLDPLVDAQYAPDIEPTKMTKYGSHGGVFWENEAVRSSIGDAYGYNIETDNFQVADDLERIARAGYVEIHIATGTHGDEFAVLSPEFRFLREDARSIYETMQRHPGLKIIPYNMADPMQAAMFETLQAQAAEGKLPGGATQAAFCYSRNRVPDPNSDPAGAYASVELLERRGGLGPHLGAGGFTAAMGAWSIYSGLHDPNAFWRTAKVASGGLQVAGGMSYALGYATESIRLAKFGSTIGEFGGAAGQALAWVDIYRDMQRKFDPNAPAMTDTDALEEGLKVAGAIFPELAFHAIIFHYGVRPVAEETAEFVTPIFSGAIKQIYNWPPTF